MKIMSETGMGRGKKEVDLGGYEGREWKKKKKNYWPR